MAIARGSRPIRVANCSGYIADPPRHMYRQAVGGPVDVITGDYLAEVNIANNAEAYLDGKHPGYEPTARDGIFQTLEVLNEKRIKVVVNGGALSPKSLATTIRDEVSKRGLNLAVAYVEGDDVRERLPELFKNNLTHLDSENQSVKLAKHTKALLDDPKKPVVSANAYLGARGIRSALEEGADIVICGRVADASPVIGAIQWWFGWSDQDFDQLAQALLAGHLIECSSYITGANFAGFYKYPIESLLDLGLPIAEVSSDGSIVVTKHEAYNGFVTADTVRCQLLYELQGNIYLNSDVKADLTNVEVTEVGKNR